MDNSNNSIEINDIFELSKKDKEGLKKWTPDKIKAYVIYLQDRLEGLGEKCNTYVALRECTEKSISDAQKNDAFICDDYVEPRWRQVLESFLNIYDMLGYLTLLQMDTITTIINLLQAKSDTERILQCKHAYTILYEAKENDLFKKVSAEMKKYPEELINKEEYRELWKSIKDVSKEIFLSEEAKEIRNSIDAHKDHSFLKQISAYKKCNWTKSVLNLFMFDKLVDLLQQCMDIIKSNAKKLAERNLTEIKEYGEMLEVYCKAFKILENGGSLKNIRREDLELSNN